MNVFEFFANYWDWWLLISLMSGLVVWVGTPNFPPNDGIIAELRCFLRGFIFWPFRMMSIIWRD